MNDWNDPNAEIIEDLDKALCEFKLANSRGLPPPWMIIRAEDLVVTANLETEELAFERLVDGVWVQASKGLPI